MKKIISTFLFIVYLCNLHAQDSFIEGFVLDERTLEPLEYANITYIDTKTGTSSDSKGHFRIPIVKGQKNIKLSAIGYHSLLMTLDSSQNNIVIHLEPKTYTIPEYAIEKSSGKTKKVSLGYYPRKNRNNFGWRVFPGHRRATFIENKDYVTGTIEAIRIFLTFDNPGDKQKNPNDDCCAYLRIRLLSHDPNSFLPNEDLLLTNFIIKPTSQKDRYIDLSQYAIQMPLEGVWVCIDWLENPTCNIAPNRNQPPYLMGHDMLNENYTFAGFRNNGKWHAEEMNQYTNRHANPSIEVIVNSIVRK